MTFVTDFADQAVVLPLTGAVAIALLLLGWRRGAVAWLVALGCTLGLVLMFKLAFIACGPSLGLTTLRSPSGHTAAATAVAGGLALVAGWRLRTALVLALAVAGLVGTTRLTLGMHTPPEVIVGGALGLAGVLGFAWLAGTPPRLRLRWLLVAALVAALLLHGRHLNAESRIRGVAFNLPFCSGNPAQLRPPG